MRSIPMTMTLVAMTMCSTVAFAHGDGKHGEAAKTDAKTGEAAKPAGDMKMAPAPEMEMLKKLTGTYAVTEKMEPSPMAPKGGEGKGTAVFTAGPGGVSIMNYKSTGPMGKFEGMEVLTWDAQASAYKSYWVDSMHGVGGEISMGKMEGDKLVFTAERVGPDGKAMSTRRTVTHTSPTEWTMVMEGSTDGGTTWMKHLTVTGKKKSGKSS